LLLVVVFFFSRFCLASGKEWARERRTMKRSGKRGGTDAKSRVFTFFLWSVAEGRGGKKFFKGGRGGESRANLCIWCSYFLNFTRLCRCAPMRKKRKDGKRKRGQGKRGGREEKRAIS